MMVSRPRRHVLASIGRHWGWIMAFGVLRCSPALRCWPGRPHPGRHRGIVRRSADRDRDLQVRAAFAADDLTGGTRVLLAVLGVLSLIIGLYAVRHVLVTLLALALLLGIFWIVNDPWNCSWPCPTGRWRTAAGRP